MSGGKKLFGKKKKASEEMTLQITSMADIFTILLVFLLKSFSTSMTTVTPADGMRLPVASVQNILKDTLKLEITQDSILIDQKKVVKLKGFEFERGELPEHGMGGPLYKFLIGQRKLRPSANTDSTLLLLADERTPYSTIKAVLGSAAGAGFVDLQLVVVQND